MPYDHKNTTPDGVSSLKMKSLLEELNHLHCQKRCMIGSGGGSVGLVLLIPRPNLGCGSSSFVHCYYSCHYYQ